MTGVPLRLFVFAVLAACCTGFAWWAPGSMNGALLGWAGAFGVVLLLHQSLTHGKGMGLKPLLLTGCVIQVLGFYWLVETIHRFGEFPLSVALLLFALFVIISALQFPLFGVARNALPSFLDRFALRTPIAWVSAELWSVRIFPWHLGHTQLPFLELVQISDLVGSLGISFLMMWLAEGFLLSRRYRLAPVLPVLALSLSLLYGHLTLLRYEPFMIRSQESPSEAGSRGALKIAVVQGNIPLHRENDNHSPALDIVTHFHLSKPFDQPDTLIIWPETAIMHWVSTDIHSRLQDPRLPRFQQAALLTGTLMFRDNGQRGEQEDIFNSAIVISPDDTLSAPYHKRILMPYGEYTPLSETFPALLSLNPMAANFTAGEKPTLHQVQASKTSPPLPLATLICYEDVLQSLAAESVRAGAEVLVNLTNDAWFGDSPALRQHHQIASFRAIENKRFHIRATNTGLSGVISPIGETIAELPSQKAGALSSAIFPLREVTLFSRHENTVWHGLALLCLICIAIQGGRWVRRCS